jgi:uncharacterized small protein (DUF1192 family)
LRAIIGSLATSAHSSLSQVRLRLDLGAVSVQSYRNRVAALEAEIARLREKAGKEREKASKARQEAQRIHGSITRHTSDSTRSRKLRDAEKKEEKAAKHDQEAAKFEGQAATKEKNQLGSARRSLEAARKQEAQKEQREGARRHRDELRELKRIEDVRRAAHADPAPTFVGLRPRPAPRPQRPEAPTFDVCLSFAGEQRSYVKLVAEALNERGYSVFYDEEQVADTWGKDLAEYFDWVYRQGSRACVMFISEDYARKSWTTLERRSALARAVEQDEYLLPVRFDETELPGLRPTIGYVGAGDYATNSLAELIAEKLGDPMTSSD